MRLWVVLDERIDIELIDINDLILVTPKSEQFLSGASLNFERVSYRLLDEKPYAADIVNEIFSFLSPKMWPYKNKFYMSIVRPLCSIIYQIKTIIEHHNVTEVVLTGGSEYVFLSCYKTNGEGKPVFYKTSWMLNSILNKYITANYKDVSIIWRKKGYGCFYHCLNVIREGIVRAKIAIAEYRRKLLHKDVMIIPNDSQNKIKSVAIAYLDLQMNHLRKVVNENNQTNIFVVTSNVSISNPDGLLISRIRPNNFLEILKCLHRITKKEKNRAFSIEKNYTSITLCSKDVYRAVKSEILLHELASNSFRKELDQYLHLSTIYTDGTFGTDLILCHKYAQERGIKHINYQNVTMNKMLFPIIELADEYYLFAKKTYDLYRHFSDSYYFFFPVFRKPQKGDKNQLIVSVFLQPDSYSNKSIRMISSLIPLLDNLKNVKQILVKPHYRQADKINTINELCRHSSKTIVCNKADNATELICRSDFVVSITSSVLFEAVSYGVPGIIVDYNGEDHDFIYNNDSHGKEVNFYIQNYDEITSIIKEYDLSFSNYVNKRKQYFDYINMINRT